MGKNSRLFVATVLFASLSVAVGSPAVATGHSNPVDRVSNSQAHDYTDVKIAPRKLHEPFVRDGIVTEPQGFTAITRGIGKAQVEAMLGAPVRRNGRAWDYNFKFRMSESRNYLVCQYKVVFDGQDGVGSG